MPKVVYQTIDMFLFGIITFYGWVWILPVCFINICYYMYTKREKNRINRWYTYRVLQDQTVVLHFTPLILIGYRVDKKLLVSERQYAINLLQELGFASFLSETLSLHRINPESGFMFLCTLKKWDGYGFVNLLINIWLTVMNRYNWTTFSVSRKLYLLIFKNKFCAYQFKGENYAENNGCDANFALYNC